LGGTGLGMQISGYGKKNRGGGGGKGGGIGGEKQNL